MKYYYDSEKMDEIHKKILDMLSDKEFEVIDTSSWSDEKKKKLYYRELIKLRVKQKKPLKKKLTTDESGVIHYDVGLLVDGDDFFVGEEIIDILE